MRRTTNGRAAARAEAIDTADRVFFLWLLAGLVTGTMISGAIAMWSVLTGPALG